MEIKKIIDFLSRNPNDLITLNFSIKKRDIEKVVVICNANQVIIKLTKHTNGDNYLGLFIKNDCFDPDDLIDIYKRIED